jgi:hypothetical protein
MEVDDIVRAYIHIREKRSDILAAYEDEDRELKKLQDEFKAQILAVCNEIGVESLKTKDGTASKILKERYYTIDWENFGKFVVENNLVSLLERRIHQGNFKEYYEENKDDGLPPGVNVMREFDIQVRKNRT